jgi:hypothetical protein
MTKRVLIVLLAGLNLVLLVGFLSRAFSPQPAWAQGAARGHDYALIAGRLAQGNDALYMIDGSARRMHVFRTNFPRVVGTPTRVALIGSRDLARDFGRKEAR